MADDTSAHSYREGSVVPSPLDGADDLDIAAVTEPEHRPPTPP
jgi:hypothetical protein